MITDKNWKEYIGKEVRLIIEDSPYPRPKDGIFISIDRTHIFLKVNIKGKEEVKPFSRDSVKRVDAQ